MPALVAMAGQESCSRVLSELFQGSRLSIEQYHYWGVHSVQQSIHSDGGG
jgi:hypothetical protein